MVSMNLVFRAKIWNLWLSRNVMIPSGTFWGSSNKILTCGWPKKTKVGETRFLHFLDYLFSLFYRTKLFKEKPFWFSFCYYYYYINFGVNHYSLLLYCSTWCLEVDKNRSTSLKPVLTRLPSPVRGVRRRPLEHLQSPKWRMWCWSLRFLPVIQSHRVALSWSSGSTPTCSRSAGARSKENSSRSLAKR